MLCVVKSKEKSHTFECAELGKSKASQAICFASPVSGQTKDSYSELNQAAARSDNQCQAPDLQHLPGAPLLLMQFLFSNLACP